MNKILQELDQLFKSGKWNQVVKKIKKIINSDNVIVPYYNLLGLSLSKLGKDIEAEEIFIQGIRKFDKETEGELAKRFSFLVCKKTLIEIASNVKIDNYILVSSDVGIRSLKSITANSLEALIAAIFLDSDFEVTRKIVINLWKKFLKKDSLPPTDPKSKLQEWCLKNKKKLPCYELLKKIGPDHEPTFTIKVIISDKIFTSAKGKNKQDAEVNAANKLLEKIGV